MAFIQFNLKDGLHKPFEYLPADDVELEIGTALVISSGLLTPATATATPTYISQYKGTPASGEVIPVTRVDPEQVYATELSEDSDDIAVGVKYTIDTTGGMITATDTSGVAEVVAFDGTEEGARVLVRFS